MDTSKEVVSSESRDPKGGNITYRPSFLKRSDDVDTCIEMTNMEESELVDSVDLSRITTGWIHRILHHVGTVMNRENGKDYRFQPKFFEK